MESIKEELGILIKAFPFIKFTITQPYNDIRIIINSIDSKLEYVFFYNVTFNISCVGAFNFKEFLNKFIFGLIYWELY